MPGLCSSRMGKAGGFRDRGIDEHLCVDGRHISPDGRVGLDHAQLRPSDAEWAGAITGGRRRIGDHRVIEVGVHVERDGDRGPEVDRTQPLRELPFAVFEALGDYGAIRHSGLSPSADHRSGCRLA